jgi:hypothetical protein
MQSSDLLQIHPDLFAEKMRFGAMHGLDTERRYGFEARDKPRASPSNSNEGCPFRQRPTRSDDSTQSLHQAPIFPPRSAAHYREHTSNFLVTSALHPADKSKRINA